MAQGQTQISHALQFERKRLFIDATIGAISEYGLANLTLAKIAGLAGLTAASVNFHFASKEALLLATLKYVAEEFDQAINKALSNKQDSPPSQLLALVDVNLDPLISDAKKVAVWYAFLSAARSREDYQKICGDRDHTYYTTVKKLCRQLVNDAHKRNIIHADAIGSGLTGLLDECWQEILFYGDEYDREAAGVRCRAYLASVFPWCFDMPLENDADTVARLPDPDSCPPAEEQGLIHTLPSWVYNSEEFFRLEKETIFLPAWQLVCHINDLPQAGSFITYDFFNERAFVIRDKAGNINAFHNVCPHRAHSIVQGEQGRCNGRLTCPYHGWTYALDGRRIGIAAPETFRQHDKNRFGLSKLDCEVFLGFVYIRFRPNNMSVADYFAPVAGEFAAYKTADMRPVQYCYQQRNAFWTKVVDVDWKNAVENYVEDYHFPTGHKGLSALMRDDYDREPLAHGLARLSHEMRDKPLNNWSANHYHKLLPAYDYLPVSLQRRWTYYALFPNTFFDIFPEKMDFMQMIPLAPGRMMLRGRSYAHEDHSRLTRVIRYLSDRINTRVQDEDNFLTAEVQQGLSSSAYHTGILSDKEILVKHFQDWIRTKIPASGSSTEQAVDARLF